MPARAKGKPSLRFFHSAALRARTDKLLAAIDRDEDPKRHAAELADLVASLTEAGLDYYYLKPLEKAKVSFVARKTADLGMAGALRFMSPVIRSILGSMEGGQLRVVSRHIRELMD
jgi:hypothetical protein